jgi:hypothetical protein
MVTIPPKSPIASRSDHVRPSSAETAMRIGWRPEKRIRRFVPSRGSITRWIVGVSLDVDQFSGTARRCDQVSPPSGLRFITIAPRPWPLG